MVDPQGRTLAGARSRSTPDGPWLADEYPARWRDWEPPSGTNTTLVAVLTNARLNKVEASRLAQRTHNGLVYAIRPAHTSHDGDTAYAVSVGTRAVPFDLVANTAVDCVAEAIYCAVQAATSHAGIPGLG